jgi:hypothetical protein
MEKQYIATQTISFTDGQVLADIIKGNEYTADFEEEYFIGQFGNMIYLPQSEFFEYFEKPKGENARNYRNEYFRNKVKCITLKLFQSDQDIIDHLAKMKTSEKSAKKNGVCEYIRRLIREDMQRNNKL